MKNHLFSQKTTKLTQKCKKLINSLVIVASSIVTLVSPHLGYAQVITVDGINVSSMPVQSTTINVLKTSTDTLPVISSRKPMMTVNMVVTAYTSQVAQTDDSPCITASGMDVCERGAEDIVATNFNWLPFGTRIKIPELFGDRVFIIHDRMNARYSQRVDVWMKSYADAVKFGKKYATVEIY